MSEHLIELLHTPSQRSHTIDHKSSDEESNTEPEISASTRSVSVYVDINRDHFGVYHKMRHPLVMIIGVTTYKGEKSNGWKPLLGVTKDIKSMQHLWKHVLKFDTETLTDSYPNCSKKNILNFRTECQQVIFTQAKRYDGLICIFSGHGMTGQGMRDQFISGDGEEIDIQDNFFRDFNAEHLDMLANYPKIFLFDTCRGGIPPKVKNKLLKAVKGTELISCNTKDGFRISYATTSGNTVPSNDDGSDFIHALYDVMINLYCNKKLNDTDLNTILDSSSQKAKLRTANAICPVHSSTANYKIFIKCKYGNFVPDHSTYISNWSLISLKSYTRNHTSQELEKKEEGYELKSWFKEHGLPHYELFKKQNAKDLKDIMKWEKSHLQQLLIPIQDQVDIYNQITELRATNVPQRKASVCCNLRRLSLCSKDMDKSPYGADQRCFCVVL